VDIIASGPHNKTPMVRLSPRLQAQRLGGMQPPPPRDIVASFRTVSGLGCCGGGLAGKTKQETAEEQARAGKIFGIGVAVLAVVGVVLLARAGTGE